MIDKYAVDSSVSGTAAKKSSRNDAILANHKAQQKSVAAVVQTPSSVVNQEHLLDENNALKRKLDENQSRLASSEQIICEKDSKIAKLEAGIADLKNNHANGFNGKFLLKFDIFLISILILIF